jgi:molybdopterin molybdotransferase
VAEAQLTGIEEARTLILERCTPPASERVPLADALGRVLAEPIAAAERVPGFDNSAMDGYAVRAADVASVPATLRLAGEARAGHPFDGVVGQGEAVTISTGAPLPDGADTVIRVEDTSLDADVVEIAVGQEEGANVRRAGDDVEPGQQLLEPGAVLDAVALGVLASVGVAEPSCAPAPRVALLSTGDELVGVGEELPPGGVRNSNSYALPGLVGAAGGDLVKNGRVADDPEATRETVQSSLAEADVLVVCGGVSVGPHDHVKGAFEACGVEQVFWRVSLKPGKPAYFGVAPGGKLVFGLPGNPVSAFVTFLLFVRPALLALQGADPGATRVEASLTQDYSKPADRAHAIRVRIEDAPAGRLATPAPHQGSHVMTSLLGAGGLGLIPAETTSVAAGERITVELIDAGALRSGR